MEPLWPAGSTTATPSFIKEIFNVLLLCTEVLILSTMLGKEMSQPPAPHHSQRAHKADEE